MKSNKLGLLTTKIGSGITPRGGQSVYQNSGTHLIRSQNIHNHKFEKNGLVCISQEIAEKMKSVEIMTNDVLINITGDSVARVYLVPDEILPARVNQHVCILRTKPELNPHYLYYFLINPTTQNHLLSIAGIGGTRNALTKEMLYNLIIEYPDLPTQEKIVKQLNTIKNKIITLENQNRILEQTAQAIFKSWFVDFDGVTEWDDSELGKIPKGWSVDSIFNCANYVNGSAFRNQDSSLFGIGLPVIKITELKFGISSKTLFTEKNMDSKYHLHNNDILFAWSGSPDTSIDTFIWTGGDAILNQHIHKINLDNIKEKPFIYFLFKYFKKIFIEIARNKQTTGLGHVTLDDMKKLLVVLPNKKFMEYAHKNINPIFKSICNNLYEFQSLIKTRDALLPKLMSGEIRI